MSNAKANVVFLIDIQEGFARPDLPNDKGGCLYVPGGEAAGAPAAKLIKEAKNTIFVLSGDFHPDNIISDMTNHPGVMAYRKELAQKAAVDEKALPFTNVLLRQDERGLYRVVGVLEGESVRDVETNEDGYVTKVLESEATRQSSDMVQTLWTKHCVQSTQSVLFVPEIMAALPASLAKKVLDHNPAPVLAYEDEATGNSFFVVRKGTRRDVDSNAIAIENDQKSMTSAPLVFDEIARRLADQGVSSVSVAVGGLAGNICAELSHNNVQDLLVAQLKGLGMAVQVRFMTDISQMIPISVPGGAFPDAANALTRMAAYGTKESTTDEVLRSMVQGPKSAPTGAGLNP